MGTGCQTAHADWHLGTRWSTLPMLCEFLEWLSRQIWVWTSTLLPSALSASSSCISSTITWRWVCGTASTCICHESYRLLQWSAGWHAESGDWQTARCLHGMGPLYLLEMCQPILKVAGHCHLQSVVDEQFVILHYRLTTAGRRAFFFTGPSAWNGLPVHLKNKKLNLDTFKRSLKSFLLWLTVHRTN